MGMLLTFLLWTAAVCTIDVRPIGPQGSAVGFGAVNRYFHSLTGVHPLLYIVTDWLSLVPLGFALGFALLGLVQWIRRKRLGKVDYSIRVLGGFYILVMAVYILFEWLAVNHRPVLINGVLEASYPSSTTMLVMCIMPTSVLQLQERIGNRRLKRWLCAGITGFAIFMVTGRLLSGVHWLTDIIGGILLSTGLVCMYDAVCHLKIRLDEIE